MADYEPTYDYKNNEHYIKYSQQKENIKKKYPPRIFNVPVKRVSNKNRYGDSDDRVLHRQYLKEVADLLFQPNGNYQKMVWDTMSEKNKMEMEKKSRGKLNRWSGEY